MLTSLAFLGFSRISDIEKMGLREYNLRLEAFKIQQVEVEKRLAQQAWYNQEIQATTGGKHPKRKYNHFEDFYDPQAQVDNVRGSFESGYEPQSKHVRKQKAVEIMAKRIEEYKQKKKERR